MISHRTARPPPGWDAARRFDSPLGAANAGSRSDSLSNLSLPGPYAPSSSPVGQVPGRPDDGGCVDPEMAVEIFNVTSLAESAYP